MSDNPEDPFERLAKGRDAGPSRPASRARDAGDLVAPVPANAPPLPSEWRELGAPSAAWAFRDAAGQVLRWTLRFPEADPDKDEADKPRAEWTGKTIRAATLRRGDGGRLRWALKAEPDHRPLYGLDRLAARPTAPVLIVEGEKAADAAGDRFPRFVAATWPGGSKAVAKADWSPLAGRDVVVWPDADAPGRAAALAVQRQLATVGAASVAIVDPPGFAPEGWDLADAWPEGFGPGEAEARITAAREAAQPADVAWPWGYRLDAEGLWYDAPGRDGAPPIAVKIAGPFEVIGKGRDPQGSGWSVVIRFKDPDGREKTVPVGLGRLAAGGAEVRGELAAEGLWISPARGKGDKFADGLSQVITPKKLITVSASGWCGERFVLAGEVIGPAGGERVIYTGDRGALHYGRKGTLAAWQAEVAARAGGNDLLTLSLALAFLGPLLRPLELEGGGVHVRGGSSSGKTTLALAAGSVWGGGGPLGFGQSWRSTANALEGLANGHNDALVVLDELKLILPEEAGLAAYALSSGLAKGRMNANGTNKARTEWRVAILSTGEIALADHIRSGRRGEMVHAGQEVRLLDIPAEIGDGPLPSVWQNLHGFAGGGELSDALKAATGRNYGHAGPAFVEALIANKPKALEAARAILEAFLADVAHEGDTGQVRRGAMRFGAIAAAGELAAMFGVLPWPPGQAQDAARRLFHRWAGAFGRDRSREATAAIRRVKGIIESEASAFTPWEEDEPDLTEAANSPSRAGRDEQARGLKSYGWRAKVGDKLEFRFNDVGWAHATEGLGQAESARALFEAGYLERGEGDRWKKAHKRKGVKHRLWTVKGAILEADLGD